MRMDKSFIPTLKEVPTEAVITSHILMLRGALVRMLSAGIYSYLPLGYKSLRKVAEIVREEMNAIGGQECHLPALNPKEIWEETGRVEAFGDTMFHVKNREYVLAPTHEEIIAYHAKGVIKSYKDLPQIWYHIQTKFRNEARPRSGVIRGRQFLMKDSYTLDTTFEELDKSYDLHDKAYRAIFDRCGLKYFIVGASSGAMGGSKSEEFMVKSDAGEDTVAYCEKCGYAANSEVASSVVDSAVRHNTSNEIKEIHTPGVHSIDELCAFLKINETECAKSRIYMHDNQPVLVLMLGNDEVNETKLGSVLGGNVRPCHPDELKEISGADAGSIGPIGFKHKTIADNRLKDANNLYSGANKNDYHIGGIDMKRDLEGIEYFDLRTAETGEKCVRCGNTIDVFKAIELGHIFKLGTKYSDALGVVYQDENGQEHPVVMGSYGIGCDRVLACYIEQNNDEKGIIWNKTLAPFEIHLIALNMRKEIVVDLAEKIYTEYTKEGFDILYDDRPDAQAGFKFNDADLLGMPVQVIVGEKNAKEGKVEVKIRRTNERFVVAVEDLKAKLKEILM